MGACGGALDRHNSAFGVDRKGLREGGAWDVDRSERIFVSVVVAFSPAQKKAMGACGVAIDPHNIAFGVDPKGLGEGSTGDVDRSERTLAQKKTMQACGVKVAPHDVAFGVDPKGLGEGSTGDLDGGERTPAQKKTMEACGVRVVPHDVAFGVDPKGLGEGNTGDIDGGETVVGCENT